MWVAVGRAHLPDDTMQTQSFSSTASFAPRRAGRAQTELDPESRLVAGLVAGDAAAWREFNQRYSAVIHRAIGRVIARFGSVTSSDDVREIYAKLCLALLANDKIKLRSFDPTKGARLGSWLVRLALQATYDHLRRIKRNPVDGRLELFDVPGDQPDPYAEVWEHERAKLLSRVLECLSAREREFWQLYFGQGLQPETIAARMGISVATVYSKKHKLEKRMEEIVAEQRLAA
jgi:RNA polymerase sigma-70 factor, ECF subfamily